MLINTRAVAAIKALVNICSFDLESKRLEFRNYYNRERVHSGIGGSTPCEAGGALTAGVVKLDNFRWQASCRGLYQLPATA